jgi:hypothetical protein
VTFIGRAVMFMGRAMTFVSGAVTFIGRAATFIEGTVTFTEGAVTFIGKAVTFIGGVVTFIGKGSLAVGGRLFKTARAKVANDIKVNRCNLRRRLMTYELKGLSVLMNSLIFTFNYSVRLSL